MMRMHAHEERLFTPGKPAFYCIDASVPEFENLALQLAIRHPDAIIRRLRGKKCRSVHGFFDEVSAVLQFPYYFGENWNAFDECIVDLEWAQGSAYLLLVEEADLLLADSDRDFGVLIDCLASANVGWLTPNQFMARDRQPTPFHVLFQCDVANHDAFTARLARAGAEHETLQIPIETA